MALTTTKQRKEIGGRLRTERERLNYTAQQIAQLIGVTPEIYVTYELGEADPGIFCMPRLSACVDVVEIDAASHNGVDDARELRERAGFAPRINQGAALTLLFSGLISCR